MLTSIKKLIIILGLNLILINLLTGSELTKKFDTVATGKLISWKEVANFLNSEINHEKPNKKLIWAKIEITKFHKSSPIKPKFFYILFYQNIPSKNEVVSESINTELIKGEKIWLFNAVGGSGISEPAYYPSYTFYNQSHEQEVLNAISEESK